MSIPEDIRKTADALATRWISRGHHDNAALAADIAEALMAERKKQKEVAVSMFMAEVDRSSEQNRPPDIEFVAAVCRTLRGPHWTERLRSPDKPEAP